MCYYKYMKEIHHKKGDNIMTFITKITKRAFEKATHDATLESQKYKYNDSERTLMETKYFLGEIPRNCEINTEAIKKSTVVFLESVNMGTKKWSKWEKHLRLLPIKKFSKETACYYFFIDESGKEQQIKKENVVCIVK